MEWHVRVGYTVPDTFTETVAVALGDRDDVTVVWDGDRRRLTIAAIVDAPHLVDAVDQAVTTGALTYPTTPVTVEAAPVGDLVDGVSLAALGLVTVGDLARMLGLSRQRAHALTRRPGFPPPVCTVGGRKVYDRAKVEDFLAGYDRRPGRPRKTR